jgi:hypothetical protein
MATRICQPIAHSVEYGCLDVFDDFGLLEIREHARVPCSKNVPGISRVRILLSQECAGGKFVGQLPMSTRRQKWMF